MRASLPTINRDGPPVGTGPIATGPSASTGPRSTVRHAVMHARTHGTVDIALTGGHLDVTITDLAPPQPLRSSQLPESDATASAGPLAESGRAHRCSTR